MTHDGVPRRLCSLCGRRRRTLRRVGRPGDPDYPIALCPICDGVALAVRPHPRDVPPPA